MFPIHRIRLLFAWIALGLAILAVDYLVGPNIALAYFFLVPVVLAAYYNGRGWGIFLALVLALSRFCFHFAWDNPFPLWDRVLNAAIRILILVGAAYLVDRTKRQAQEIRILRGILPICMYCKKIRATDREWHSIESYITKNSEAQFSHTFCPECGKKYYADFLGDECSTEPPRAK